MNKTEGAYEAHLALRKITKEIEWYCFEGMTFRLADRTTLTPDFCIMLADGTLECHDVKANNHGNPLVEDDASVKIKVAAAQFPIVFKLVWRVQGQWMERTI
jgi:hypothetical protein